MYTSAHPLLDGAEFSGVTLHKISRGIDTGDVIDQIKFPLERVGNSRELYFLYLEKGLELFINNAEAVLKSNFKTVPQEFGGSTYFDKKSIDYKNLEVNLNVTAFQLVNQVRAFNFREFQIPTVLGYPVVNAITSGQQSTTSPGKIVDQSEFSFTVSTVDFDVLLDIDPLESFFRVLRSGEIESAIRWAHRLQNIDERDQNGWTPLIVSCYLGVERCVLELIKLGADVNASNFNGTTPLMYAYTFYEKSLDFRICELLILQGADIHAKDHNGRNIESYSRERKSHILYEELMVHMNL
jgi:methionyl-tRNA formyltransferase